ncbi:MAG: OmpA family protein [Cytophagales bacterium]
MNNIFNYPKLNKINSRLYIAVVSVLIMSCSMPPVVLHSDRTGNKPMICFKKACRKKTHQHNMRKKAAKERFKERQARIARGDTADRRAVKFERLVEAEKQKNVITDKVEQIDEGKPKWEENMTFILNNIYFEVNSSELKTESYDQLDELADWLIKHDHSIIEISGHTDSTGDEKLNEKLSKERVRSVGLYLIKVRGIKKNRLMAKGYGSSHPIADNETEEGRQKNRRVEFTILKK